MPKPTRKGEGRLFPNVPLQAFKAIVSVRDCGTAQAAADRAGVTISTLTRQITGLENELGFDLFDRHSRGMRLTNGGREYVKAAARILRELERAGALLRPLDRKSEGLVRAYVSEALLDGYLFKQVRWLAQNFPNVKVKVTIGFADQARQALLNDEADVAAIFGMRPHEDIEILSQHRHPLVAVVGPNHPLALSGQHLIDPDLLVNPKHRLALPPGAFGTRELFEKLLSKKALTALQSNIFLELNSLLQLRNFVLTNQAVTVLPSLLARRSKLVQIRLKRAENEMSALSLCRHFHRTLNPAASALIERIEGNFRRYIKVIS